MSKSKTKTKKPEQSIQSKGGKAVVKKYGRDYMRNLVLKRHKANKQKKSA